MGKDSPYSSNALTKPIRFATSTCNDPIHLQSTRADSSVRCRGIQDSGGRKRVRPTCYKADFERKAPRNGQRVAGTRIAESNIVQATTTDPKLQHVTDFGRFSEVLGVRHVSHDLSRSGRGIL